MLHREFRERCSVRSHAELAHRGRDGKFEHTYLDGAPMVRRLATVGLLLCLPSCGPAPASFSAADEQAVRAVNDSFVRRLLRSDFANLAALYSPDAHFMPPNQPAVVGRDAFLKWSRAFPPISRFELLVEEVGGHGDVAYVRGRYTMAFTPPGAKQAIADTGKYLEVHRRQADGSWPMVADIFNSDKPAMH